MSFNINDLIKKSKGSTDETKTISINKANTPDTKQTVQATINKQPIIPKPAKSKLGIRMAKPKPVSPDEKPKSAILNHFNTKSPISELADVLSDVSNSPQDSITSILGTTANETPVPPETKNAETTHNQAEIPHSIQQDKLRSPTLDDLSKFVFDEQPDDSTEEIAFKFSNMLDGLSSAMGSDIPTVLSETLLFMKEHAFLATLLKPEEIGKLVQTMARSYGFVASNQTQKTVKKKKKAAEQNAILNSLDNLSF